jgi:hypothetical protein
MIEFTIFILESRVMYMIILSIVYYFQSTGVQMYNYLQSPAPDFECEASVELLGQIAFYL